MTAYLETITYKDTISYIPPIICGKVIKVYDGDTITIATKLPYNSSPIYRFSVRINGIDCPEMKTRDRNEQICAAMAKQTVYDIAFNKIVYLKNVSLEKYGRILADVFVDDISIGELLCQCKLAVKYDGGTKNSPEDWLKYYNNTIHQLMRYTLLSMVIDDEIVSLLNSHFIVTSVFLIASFFFNW
jgi:endonuclease YncB( thermonuclease family)